MRALEGKLAIPPHVMARQVGEECVMLDLANGTYFGLDPVGARVWQCLVEGRTPAGACDAVLAEFDAPREQVEADVARLVEDLEASGLLERVG